VVVNGLCDLLLYLAEKRDASMVEVSVGDDCKEKDLDGRVVGIELVVVNVSIFADLSVEILDVCPSAVSSP